LGLELVKDRNTLEPAREEAARIRDDMRNRGVLLATSGPLDNLIKIRPPLVFSRENADLLLETLEQAFSAV
jgi:4-aminobutyrate aminotransferase-like enzyme